MRFVVNEAADLMALHREKSLPDGDWIRLLSDPTLMVHDTAGHLVALRNGKRWGSTAYRVMLSPRKSGGGVGEPYMETRAAWGDT